MRVTERALPLVALSLVLVGASSRAPAAAEPGSGTAVLETTSFWRCHFTWRTEQVKRPSGEVEHVKIARASRGRYKAVKADKISSTAPPPAGWTAPEFDDGEWARARGPFYARTTRELAGLCLRGKFEVKDPAGAKPLALSLAYRGGALVYVNGKELARAHLPQGTLAPEAHGEPYPKEAYLSSKDQLLRWVGFGDPEKYKDRFAKRDRRLSVEIPAKLLRKGLNVLAVEVRRAPTDEILFTGKFRNSYRYSLWSMIGLSELRLAAPPGVAVVPNVSRPAGLQVWNHSTADSLHVTDHGDPNEKLRPVEISGARGGAFSGQVVASSPGPIRGLAVKASDLKGPGGAIIPASALLVRCALPGANGEDSNEGLKAWDGGAAVRYARGIVRFEALIDQIPKEVAADPKGGGAVQPIWVTVRVPREAAPGDYGGKLTISAGGAKPVEAEVRLKVAGWTLPEPGEFATHVGLIHSPETLALKYGVPMWSEKHWKLIDRSFQLSGELSNKVLYMPLLRRTYFGNEHGMVRWIKDGEGWKYDFSVVEKYLDTARRHLGKPPVVCFICWELATGSVYMDGKHSRVETAGVPFTALDPASKALKKLTGPKWGEPASKAFWKPVLAGLRKVLAERGLEKSMLVGITGDRRPGKDAVEDLKAAAPEAHWVSASHSAPSAVHGQPIGYKTQVWGIRFPPEPSEKRYYGWKRAEYVAIFPRYVASCMGKSLQLGAPLGMYRLATESSLVADLRGVGRCGADFWPVLKDKRGRVKPVLARYPENSNWHGGWLRNSFPYILAPGEDGPVATVRYEVFREGLQESEARICLEKVLTDPAKRAKLGEELAKKCQDVLDERVRAIRRAAGGMGSYMTWKCYIGAGLRERTTSLYAAAAEVEKKLGGK